MRYEILAAHALRSALAAIKGGKTAILNVLVNR